MDLTLRMDLAASFRSASQVARIVTEDWAAREMYCPACASSRLEPYKAGRAVKDYQCPSCKDDFQLKAKRGSFGPRAANSAYSKKMEAIQNGTVPHYVFVSYSVAAARVTDGFVVPGHFISPTVIAARRPLSASARRAGWRGSNILLASIPPDGRVRLIEGGIARDPAAVRAEWRRFAFLADRRAESRGWLTDVLASVRGLGQPEFHLDDLYRQKPKLQALHPRNKHVRPKIRQQVQILRDQGILESLGAGRYRIKAAR